MEKNTIFNEHPVGISHEVTLYNLAQSHLADDKFSKGLDKQTKSYVMR